MLASSERITYRFCYMATLSLSLHIRETKWKNQLENFIGEYRKHDVSKNIRNEKESSDARPYLDGVLLKQKQPQL